MLLPGDMSRGSYFSYIKIFYIKCHLWGQEDFHGHLQYSQQQCDFYDNAIMLLFVNENSNLLFAEIKCQISGGVFHRPQACQQSPKKEMNAVDIKTSKKILKPPNK